MVPASSSGSWCQPAVAAAGAIQQQRPAASVAGASCLQPHVHQPVASVIAWAVGTIAGGSAAAAAAATLNTSFSSPVKSPRLTRAMKKRKAGSPVDGIEQLNGADVSSPPSPAEWSSGSPVVPTPPPPPTAPNLAGLPSAPPIVQHCGFAYGAQHVELWFTYGANSTPTPTTSTKLGWFAFGTTHSPRCGFANCAQHVELPQLRISFFL